MPPRYAYWTIIVGDQPTAFRAGALDDIMPTFNRLKEKQPTAKLMWFQSGKLWPSRIDAREAMQVRGERGRYSDPRQDGGDKTPSRERPKWKSKDFSSPRTPNRAPGAAAAPGWRPSTGPPARQPRWGGSPEQRVKPEWKPKSSSDESRPSTKPEWKPKGNVGRPFMGRPSEGQDRPEGKPTWKPKTSGEKPEWKPKGAPSERPAWKPKGAGDRPAWKGRADSRVSGKPEWKPKSSGDRPEWKPKGADADAGVEKRKWIPKAEYKKLTGTEAKRDDNWRPGGEHKDPRQKYKDAKKAKWGRFKQAIRSRAKGKKP